MEYCYHVLAGALDHYFDMLEKIKKQVHCDTGPTFAYFLGTIIENYHLSKLNDIWAMSLLYAFPCATKL